MGEIDKEKLLKNLADNLPLLRTKANLTQAQLANTIGISRQSLVAVETQKRKLSWNVFLACILVFQNNEETKSLLTFLNIYTDDLDAFIKKQAEIVNECEGQKNEF